MKACVYEKTGKVGLREVELEKPGNDDIRIKVADCAICATDAHIVNHDMFNPTPGLVLGHEVSGIVSEVGPDAKDAGFQVGDLVVGSPLRNCGHCDQCKKGNGQYCTSYKDMNFGGMAEYKVYNKRNLYHIPRGLTLRDACLVEPLSCVMRCMDLTQIQQGQTVCLSGTGGIGLLMLQAIRMRGAAEITVIEPVKEKHELARKLGAEHVIDPFKDNIIEKSMQITNGEGFDIVIEASGARSAASPCLDIVAKCGTVTYFAVFPEDYELPLNLFKLYSKEARIQTVYTNPLIYPRAVRFAKQLNLDAVIGAEFPLEDCEAAFNAFATKKYPKVILRCADDLPG